MKKKRRGEENKKKICKKHKNDLLLIKNIE
jgi:hypothetical protein